MSTELLAGKKGVVCGVANKRSIAWSIAQRAAEAGAELAFTYQGEKIQSKVEQLAGSLSPSFPLFPCDVGSDDEIEALGQSLRSHFGTIDFMIHSIAFADRKDLEGRFVDTSREGYRLAQEISSYSLTALSRVVAPLMETGGSIVTMTYLGGERAVKNYNVMGVAKAALESSVRYLASELGERQIRVNAVSAGPINTLAARGISGFTDILEVVAEKAPLRRNVKPTEVADTAVFLVSPLSSGITGEIIYVDCGYHILGL
jgi:enoyl-[acyl-carrier protein] reductase I